MFDCGQTWSQAKNNLRSSSGLPSDNSPPLPLPPCVLHLGLAPLKLKGKAWRLGLLICV